MKMTVGAPLPEGYEPGHDDLASAVVNLIGQALLPLFAENMGEEAAQANVQGIVTELAYVFDEGEIVLGGKTYRPRIAFLDENGQALPGFEALVTLNENAEDAFVIPKEAQVSFEFAEYDEE